MPVRVLRSAFFIFRAMAIHRAGLRPDVTIAVVLASVAAACSSKPAAPARSELRRVVLPDLSHVAPSVQDQLREGYAVLTRSLETRDIRPADLGEAYGRMGMLLMAAEFRNEAEGAFLDAEALAPGQPRWPYYLGHLYKIKGDTPKSAESFGRALSLQPNDVPTLVWLGDALLDEGKPDAAEPLFTKALSLQPRLVIAEFGLGRTALARQEYSKAVAALERALALDPRATVVHYPLALAYRGMGNAARAEAHMRQRGTLPLKPDDPLMHELDTLLHSALAYEVAGADALDKADWDAAAESFRKGIAIAPEDPSLHHKLGTALALKGDTRGAVEQFEEALRLSPTFTKAHYSLGLILASNGQPRQAAEHWLAAITAEPGYVEARLQLAHMLRRTGRFEASLQHYDYIIKADPRVPEARFGYAASLVRLRRWSEARDRLEGAMADYPSELSFPMAFARLLAAAPDDKVRDGRRAVAIAQGLVDRGLRSFETLETMAMAQAEVGQFSGAVMWQRDAIATAERTADRGVAARITDNLELYEAGKPCRTPWRPDEPLEFQGTGPDVTPEARRQ
jgi:tetratricopeptide (TPR) repeat protein